MLFHFILFPLFLLAIASSGYLFSYLSCKIMRVSNGIADDLSLQGILGLAFIGFLGVCFNFFLPLTSPVFFVALGICIVLGAMIMIKERSRWWPVDMFWMAAISTMLAPLAGSMSPGYDGGLYHLPHQLWLRTEPIVFGLANLHGRFGFGSLYEYICAPLWIGNQFTLLSYVQTSFLALFLLFLIRQARGSRGRHLYLLLGIAVTLLVLHGYVQLNYTHTDIPAGFTFVIAFIYGHFLVSREQAVHRDEWRVFLMVSLSAVFYKLPAVLVMLWGFFILVHRVYVKKDSMYEFFLGSTIPIVFLGVFLIKNIVTTGCVSYPIDASCLDVPWAATKNAINDANWITAWARHPRTGLTSLENSRWIFGWWFPNYLGFLGKWLFSGLVVGIAYSGIALRTRFRTIKFADICIIYADIVIVMAFLLWFVKAPNPRFGIGVLILFFPVLLLFVLANDQVLTGIRRNALKIMVIVAVAMFGLRAGSPLKRVTLGNAFSFVPLSVPSIKVKKDSVYGVRPLKGDQCGLVPGCSPHDRPPKSTLYGRSAFIIE
jgi:hypothetical protein